MVVLHIAKIWNSSCSGVDVVVPQHVTSQSRICDCSLYNISENRIDADLKQLFLNGDFDIKKFASPFNHPDVVVFHEIYHKEYIKIYKNLLKNKIRYVIVPHSQLTRDAQKRKRLKKIVANILLFDSFIKHASGIHFLSNYELSNSKHRNNSFVVPNGMFDKQNKKTFHQTHLRFRYIGRLESYQKGLDILIEAISMVHDDIIDSGAKFDIYGPDIKGRFLKVQQLITKHNVADVVSLHHEVTGEEKKTILLETDFFIQTSRFEGMPMGILEALSYGVPCLVSEGTTLSELIRNYYAGLTSTNDSRSVADMIRNALKDKCLEEESRNAHSLIREVFEWDNVSSRCLEHYMKITDD